jgi:hypothetical protein
MAQLEVFCGGFDKLLPISLNATPEYGIFLIDELWSTVSA